MIGEELRYLLKASGVSLKMIADHAGMSNTTIQTFKGGCENQRAHTLV